MTDHRSIVPHPTNPQVLVVTEGEHWALPRHETDDAEAIRALMQERYGLDVTVLGAYTGHFTDSAREEPALIFALETHAISSILPDDARWIGSGELADTPLDAEEQRAALERWIAEAASGGVSAARAPWEHPGWFATATAWIERQVARYGWRPTGPVAQLHARAWSSVLRLPTSGGAVYFKAVTSSFAFEPSLTALLADALPEQSPRVLAIDRDRNRLLLADAGEPIRAHIRATRDPEPYQTMLVAFARFQRALVPRMEQLVATGCPDRRLNRLPGLFTGILQDADTLRVGRPGGLSPEDYARLQTNNIADLVARLADFGIPETLVQEDCHPGHWIAGPQGPVFFDWGDTCLGHPFYALMMALRWGRLVVGYDAATLDSMRDAYLAEWEDYGSLEQLRRAYQMAWQLAPLVRALTWHRMVVTQEPSARWQYGDYPPYWLGLFLHGEDHEG